MGTLNLSKLNASSSIANSSNNGRKCPHLRHKAKMKRNVVLRILELNVKIVPFDYVISKQLKVVGLCLITGLMIIFNSLKIRNAPAALLLFEMVISESILKKL